MRKSADIVNKLSEVVSTPENFLRQKAFADAYNTAKSEGRGEFEAKLLALEAGREITVNFARAGTVMRAANQAIPYSAASVAGPRKFLRQILFGGDAKGDAAKARVQRNAILNGVMQITVPSMFLAWMNAGEDWYEDLPEWRKRSYWNVKVGEDILSLPKPWEVGAIFGTLPERLFDDDPVAMESVMKDTFLGYMQGFSGFIPAVIKPFIEVESGHDFFKGRSLTPHHISGSRLPEDQANAMTTETAKVLSRLVNGKITPIEIEKVLGGYTAGAATSAFSMIDAVAGVKDSNLLSASNPLKRFGRQEVHGQSRAVDKLYDLGTRLDQEAGSDVITPERQRLRAQVARAKRQISDLRKSAAAGRITREESNRRAFEIAKPLVN